MRIKLDENMPVALAELLRGAGHDVSTVPEEQMSGKNDPFVSERAAKEDRLLMTFDVGFGDVRAYPIGSHAGIVVFRLHDQRWAALKGPTETLLASGILDRLQHGLAIIDETRVRIRFKGRQ